MIKVLVVDDKLLVYRSRIEAGIQSLINKGIITREYVATFNDYLDSTNYNYRVSLVCNLVLLAKAIENGQA